MRYISAFIFVLALTASAFAGGLDVTEINARQNSEGTRYYIGNVTNNTGQKIEIVQVKAKFYDASGKFIDQAIETIIL